MSSLRIFVEDSRKNSNGDIISIENRDDQVTISSIRKSLDNTNLHNTNITILLSKFKDEQLLSVIYEPKKQIIMDGDDLLENYKFFKEVLGTKNVIKMDEYEEFKKETLKSIEQLNEISKESYQFIVKYNKYELTYLYEPSLNSCTYKINGNDFRFKLQFDKSSLLFINDKQVDFNRDNCDKFFYEFMSLLRIDKSTIQKELNN